MASCDTKRLAHMLFVYGTLKRGYKNYERYLGIAVHHGKAAFCGAAKTRERYPLVVRPLKLPPSTCGPVLMDKPGTGHCIAGELYSVDDSTLEAMDILEGVKDGNYYKKVVEVDREGGETIPATAYFYPEKEELLALEPTPCYADEHHALYRPVSINPAIVRLCQPAASHGLVTTRSHCIEAHCLRLLPGEDLLASLKRFASEQGLEAAVVLSCVGSTSRTTLRPAGVPKPMVFEGKFEIVSLTGTLSSSGHHLHMSVSDHECNVRGGHVMEGCIVRTTAEVSLGVLDGVSFSRPLDLRTGYDELSISETLAKRQRT